MTWVKSAAVWALGAGLLAAPAAADVRAGAEAYARGDYAVALQEWQAAADAGDGNALFNLGQMFRLGKGVAKDVAKAEAYYRKAADQGHVGAQGNLGTLYYFALPDSPRVADAIKYWEAASRQGDARSQYMLGVLYYNGRDVPQDTVRGYAWMRLASAAGLQEAVEAEKLMISKLSVDELAAGGVLAQSLMSQSLMSQPPISSGGTSQPAAAGLAPVSTVAGYYVQVGALATRASAEETQTRLSARISILNGAANRIEEATAAGGSAVYRLQYGPYAEKAAASRLCGDLQAAGVDCFIVKAPAK